jgi:signal transduction histidine kinase
MHPLFSAALLPIIGVSAVLGLRARAQRPALAAYCGALALWAASVLLALWQPTRPLGERMLMAGFFVPVGLLATVREAVGVGTARGVRAFIAVAAGFTLTGALWPHLFEREGGTAPGPLFPLMLSAGAVMSLWPIWVLVRALPEAPPMERERLRYLLVAGVLSTWGGGTNVLLLVSGHPSPLGLYMVLAALVLLAWVLRSARLPSFGRFLESSLRYSAAAAGLSTLWLLLAVALVSEASGGQPSLWDSANAALLLFLVVLVGQPLLAGAREWLAGRLHPGKGDLEGMVEALAQSEARAEHQGRLAELGVLSAAVAHEVRNPLGVIRAAVGLLERSHGAQPATEEIRAQVERASRFADELLEYGRPAPLSLRPVDLLAIAELAAAEASRALPLPEGEPSLTVRGEAAVIAADLLQVQRMIGILVDNARLAAPGGRVLLTVTRAGAGACLRVADSGPGVPIALRPRLFTPFATGRGRDGPRPGTGLGLVIARGICERHGGTLLLEDAPDAELGGAAFVATLPTERPLPAGGG